MQQFVLRRLIQAVVVVIGVSFVTYAATLLTGDPVALLLPEGASLEQREELRKSLGLDQPIPVQYALYLSRAVRGDFGQSLRHHESAMKLVLERLPATAELTLAALFLSVAIAVPAGVISATRRGSIADNLTTVGVLLGQALPNFWLGLMIILIFGVHLRWLPISGRDTVMHLVGPAFTLAAFSLARNTRLVRSSLLEILGEDYIRTARAKGLSERVVIYRHALRNALAPLVTVVGLQLGFFLGGAVITETIFSWPGLGRLIVQSIYARDFPIIQAGVFLLASGFVLINLLVDIMYAYLDPRIRLG